MTNYNVLNTYYSKCNKKNNLDHLRVDWPNYDDLQKRYENMINSIPLNLNSQKKTKVLDLGCGLSGLFLYLKKNKLHSNFKYVGLDINKDFIDECNVRYPENIYINGDILNDSSLCPKVDFTIMNGLFTQKINLSNKKMFDFMVMILKLVHKKSCLGYSFNLMSPLVDYKLKKSFHMEFKTISELIVNNFSRNFIINHNYLPYEFIVSVYK